LSARLGDADAADRYAAALDGTIGGADDTLRSDLAKSVRAHVAIHRGDPAGALELLEAMALAPEAVVVSLSPFRSFALERFARAELLGLLGRDAEALRWYASVAESPPFGYVFRAAAHLRQGEIHERLGRTGRAIGHYDHVLRLWRNPDPDLQPLVRDAAARLARLR
jgi:tetratricopeptide (TPR) repeat protein